MFAVKVQGSTTHVCYNKSSSQRCLSSRGGRNVTIVRPMHHLSQKKTSRARALDNNVADMTMIVGKYITMFTLFYTSLNYMFYRDLRKRYEDDDEHDT